ncbi:F0F1 ATP synthase subunit B [Arcanobacterium haemolyticum]|nr:F0F1 ATP synthase subunit B [Arcanobacterium haemolyticum]
MLAEEHSLLIPAIPDLVWGTISFLIVAVVVYKFAWPTFMRTLDERSQKIDEGLNAAARAREEIEGERAQLATEIDDARREATRIREQAQVNAADIVASAQKKATAEANRITDAAQEKIGVELRSARQSLRADVGSLATTLAARIVGEQALDPNVSKSVVDNFLDELETSTTAKES